MNFAATSPTVLVNNFVKRLTSACEAGASDSLVVVKLDMLAIIVISWR